MFGMASRNHRIRTDLGGTVDEAAHDPSRSRTVVRLVHLSDLHVIDVASPARAEWVELLGDDPRWRPLLHMHRPYEALTHWALAAHVDAIHRDPTAPWTGDAYDLALSTGDNIDNAQRNELDAYLAIMAGGRTQLPASGGPQDPDGGLDAGTPSPSAPMAPWPFWCPDPRRRRHVEAARLPGGRGLLRARRRAAHVTGRRHPVGEPARQPRRDAPGHVADEPTAGADRRRIGQVVAAPARAFSPTIPARCSSTRPSGSRAARCGR